MRLACHLAVVVPLLPLLACGSAPSSTADLQAAAEDLTEEDEGLEPEPDLAVHVPRSFADIETFVLRPLCAAFPACHSSRGASGGLVLETNSYLALVGVAATQPLAAAERLVRVRPCDPGSSFLWIKLNRTDPLYRDKDYGSPMPLDRPVVPAAQKQAIREWILRGAPRDEGPDGGGTPCASDGGLGPDGP